MKNFTKKDYIDIGLTYYCFIFFLALSFVGEHYTVEHHREAFLTFSSVLTCCMTGWAYVTLKLC